MRKINSILLYTIVALGLIAAYTSTHCLNIILDQIIYLDKEIDNDSLYTIIVGGRPLTGFLKDLYVNISIYETIIKSLFISMLAIGFAYSYCLYRKRKCKKQHCSV